MLKTVSLNKLQCLVQKTEIVLNLNYYRQEFRYSWSSFATSQGPLRRQK